MFFLPLFDDNPARKRPLVSWSIIALCVLVYLYQSGLIPRQEYLLILHYGVIPARLFSEYDVLTIISSMFLHGGFMHLGSNMLYLWIFGDNVEDAMGRFRFLFILLGLRWYRRVNTSFNRSAIIHSFDWRIRRHCWHFGAYIMLYPRATVKVFMWIIIFVRLINIPAWIVLGFWIGEPIFSCSSRSFIARWRCLLCPHRRVSCWHVVGRCV